MARHSVVTTLVAAWILSVAPAQGGASTSSPTLAQVETAIAQSADLRVPPDLEHTLPPLASLGPLDATLQPQRPACDQGMHRPPVVSSDALTTCAYGDVHSHVSVLLTGDSQAGMWLPALDRLGREQHVRVVVLAKSGCSPWGNPNPPTSIVYGTVRVATCARFVAAVQRFANLHDFAQVIVTGRAIGLGGFKVQPTYRWLLRAQVRTLEAFARGRSHPRLTEIGPIPGFNRPTIATDPTTCLLRVRPLTRCELPPSKLISAVHLAAARAATRMVGAQDVDVTKLLCTPTHCALVLTFGHAHRLLYYDGDHLNSTFTTWVAPALGSMVGPLG